MRDDIKKRIETIRRGEVPEDYIRTEFGVMPKEWRKLLVGDVIEFYSEKSTKNNEYPVLTSSRSGLALQAEYFEGQVTREENAGYNIIPYGYCTFRSRSDDGQFTFNQNTIIDKGIVSCFYPVFRVKEAVAVDTFVLCFLNNYLGRQILKEIVGTSQLVLSEKKLNSLRIAVPPVSEQKKIAKILSVCDRAIELKQKLVEELQSLKKTCLSKMFPRNGENVPELRFPIFTAPWEQRKVSAIASDTRGGGTPATSNETYWSGDIPWIQSSDLSEGKLFGVEPRKYISREGLNNSATQLVPENSIAVVTRVGVGKLAFMPFSYTTSQDFLSLCKLQAEPHFTVYTLYQMLQGELQAVQGTSIKGMTKDDLLSKSIFVPKDEVEQQQLGSYFRSLDTLITLHQRELEEERKRKTTLMRLLLTGIVRVNA